MSHREPETTHWHSDFPRDSDGLEHHFRSLFASIPHQWYTKNHLGDYEGYYASVFYSHFAALGLDLQPEDGTSQGRIDLTYSNMMANLSAPDFYSSTGLVPISI